MIFFRSECKMYANRLQKIVADSDVLEICIIACSKAKNLIWGLIWVSKSFDHSDGRGWSHKLLTFVDRPRTHKWSLGTENYEKQNYRF